jgi:cell division protein FtsW
MTSLPFLSTAARPARDPAPDAANVATLCVLTLAALGMVMAVSVAGAGVHSRGGEEIVHGPFPVILAQGLKLLAGVLAFALAASVPTAHLRRLAPHVFAIALCLCLAAAFLGPSKNNARRWLEVGGLSFQPVELLKLGLVLVLARMVADRPARVTEFGRGFLLLLLPVVLALGVALIQPDVGSGILLVAAGLVLLHVAGVRLQYFLCGVPPVVAVAVWYGLTRLNHLRVRWHGFMHPEPTDQLSQGLVALGSGGPWGKGLGQGFMKSGFVPEARNDFLFAIVGEELGFLGCAGVLLLFCLFGYAGLKAALNARDRFAGLVACGLTAVIVLQAFFNMAVVTGCIPTKGIDLPFLSSGGTNLLGAMAAAGLVVRVGRKPDDRSCEV